MTPRSGVLGNRRLRLTLAQRITSIIVPTAVIPLNKLPSSTRCADIGVITSLDRVRNASMKEGKIRRGVSTQWPRGNQKKRGRSIFVKAAADITAAYGARHSRRTVNLRV